ncbi:uracil-DNA glycosylase family protein [Neisseria leonii]|uniref:Uracil-DNA glycosylase n=1 Tax=Neisseria leonii TaxID=2995413 RepID=A0A9X4IBL2_9NEIS|nr:uracil-DNA glycosylase family protein [Neisseria sp. 51.81]MDD9328540.1 uracil-DNA glycosylase [Neisseria sp. 51.81]
MLSSRYLHLHEALGLGPMWLRRGAKLRLPETARTQAETADTLPGGGSPPAPAARETLLAAVRQAAKTATPSAGPNRETAAPASAADTADKAVHLEALRGRIQPAKLMLATVCPTPDDLMAGSLFSGTDGILLDNMLAAIGLTRAQTHCTAWLANTAFTPQPSADDMLAAVDRIQAELTLSEAKALIVLGQIFEQPDHGAAARQACAGIPLFLLPHPARLLRQPHLKAQAWQTLKQIRRLLQN